MHPLTFVDLRFLMQGSNNLLAYNFTPSEESRLLDNLRRILLRVDFTFINNLP